MINIGFDLISDHCGVTLHPRVSTVSALTMVLRHVGLLATQSAGPSVHGAAPGVGAALQPGGTQDAGGEHTPSEIQLNQLGLKAHAACLNTFGLHIYYG